MDEETIRVVLYEHNACYTSESDLEKIAMMLKMIKMVFKAILITGSREGLNSKNAMYSTNKLMLFCITKCLTSVFVFQFFKTFFII